MFKTLIKLTLSTTAKTAGYAYGYSSVHAINMSKFGITEAKSESKTKKES